MSINIIMSIRVWLCILAVMTCVVLPVTMAQASALKPAERMEDPALENRARALYDQLRCVVCESQSLAESPVEIAAAQRALVRDRLLAGDSDAAILATMQDLYGDGVLMRPPVKPATSLLWAMPFLFLIAGGVIAVRFIKRGTA